MKLTTVTQVSVDGVMQGNGPSEWDRRVGFKRDGWALPLFQRDDEATRFVNQVYQRADAFLFGRRTYEIFAASWGTWADDSLDARLVGRSSAPAGSPRQSWAGFKVGVLALSLRRRSAKAAEVSEVLDVSGASTADEHG